MHRALAPALLAAACTAQAGPQADVVHWWTSPGETAAMHALADAYRAAGWLWSSKAALRQAGVKQEPRSMAELFAALDKLQAAGLIPLAHGGQPWQDLNLFSAVLANQGGRELYLAVFRERDAAALQGEALR